MDGEARILRGDLHGGVDAAGGGAADEERGGEALALHLLGDVDHLVEAGSDEAGEADDVHLLTLGGLEDFFSGNHHA